MGNEEKLQAALKTMTEEQKISLLALLEALLENQEHAAGSQR